MQTRAAIDMTIFMVLSSWDSHCKSSPGSFDECSTAPGGRPPLDQPGQHYVRRRSLLLLSRKADTDFVIPLSDGG